jgi:hypothetical protein
MSRVASLQDFVLAHGYGVVEVLASRKVDVSSLAKPPSSRTRSRAGLVDFEADRYGE